jgi:hypothetical protein
VKRDTLNTVIKLDGWQHILPRNVLKYRTVRRGAWNIPENSNRAVKQQRKILCSARSVEKEVGEYSQKRLIITY